MARETKEIVLKEGEKEIKVIIKAWLNKGEELELLKFFASRAKEADGEFTVTDPVAMIDYYKLLVSIWVLSLDGLTENVLERMLEMRPKQYDEVIEFIKANKEQDEEKKTPEMNNTGDSSQTEVQK